MEKEYRTMVKNNQVTLRGEIVSDFEFSHEMFGEKFYTTMLASERLSGAKDVIPIIVSDKLVDTNSVLIGKFVEISGQFRSCNKHESGKNKLLLYVFSKEFKEAEEEKKIYEDIISLDGYICREPVYRETPLGREISEILIAINRPYGKSDYIPCIAWGRNAKFADRLEIGTRLQIDGRIQSREYRKKLESAGDEYKIRTAYEVSIYKMEVKKDE